MESKALHVRSAFTEVRLPIERVKIDLVTFSKLRQIGAVLEGFEAKYRGEEASRGRLASFRPRTSKEGSMNAVFSLAFLALSASPSDAVLYEFASQRCTHCQAMQPVVAQLTAHG